MSYDDKKRDELDAFWDIDRLLPKRSQAARRPAPRGDISATEIQLSPKKDDGTPLVQDQPLTKPTYRVIEGERSLVDDTVHYVPPHMPTEAKDHTDPYEEYTTDGSLIHKVQLFHWPTNYHYFEQFFKDAIRFSMRSAEPARPVPFFSYLPQYDQLTASQANWYVYWREQVRNSTYPRTDYAYVLLYVFELLNLPADREEACHRAASLTDLWLAYRQTYPQLDHYVSEWLCDYCLIHRLDAPSAVLNLVSDDLSPLGSLREFYLNHTAVTGNGDTAARVLLSHCCSYDFRKSKFASGEYRALFYEKIPAAVASVLPLLLGHGHTAPLIRMQDCTVTRDAYTGALCAHMNKRRIKVSYTSFSRSHELRFLIGDMVRHAENRIRGWIGVRSKLSVMSLPPALRDAVDAYLMPQAPSITERAHAKAADRPAYERQYDLPVSATMISMDAAKQIESSSWDTTQVLTEAFVEEEVLLVTSAPTPEPVPASPTFHTDSELSDALGELTEFIRLALGGDFDGQRAYARRMGQLPDAIADQINEITCEHVIFDMILEEAPDGYVVVDEYRATLTQQLHL